MALLNGPKSYKISYIGTEKLGFFKSVDICEEFRKIWGKQVIELLRSIPPTPMRLELGKKFDSIHIFFNFIKIYALLDCKTHTHTKAVYKKNKMISKKKKPQLKEAAI